ncbi:DNA-processing protein DprA [Arachidicoccus sp.]|uniref:DNA-processing protein DprA n=1 Tax=Arachidicoccus sp. TaxID=1872624 RepID=UPI003D24BFAE
MSGELLYQIALTMIPNMGIVSAKKLIDYFKEASLIFEASENELSQTGISFKLAAEIRKFKNFSLVEKEIAFIDKYNIRPLFCTDCTFPRRLLNCFDPPVLLYFLGNCSLNDTKIVSVIGTRNNTLYGKKVAEQIIEELAAQKILIVSGFAYGINSIVHQAALNNGLETIGVLANGLQTIYPAQNKRMAAEMVAQGGLLTEFTQDTKPDKLNFPRRNRIVAGMTDATIVIESSKKGSSMITAEIAGSYEREIFAVPGRTTDEKSSGNNFLIQSNRAALFTDTQQFLYAMNWNTQKQRQEQHIIRYVDLDPNEQTIVDILRDHHILHIDELQAKSALNESDLAQATLKLESASILLALPNNMYQLI